MHTRTLLGGRLRIDTLIVTGFALIGGMLAMYYELFEHLHTWAEQYENWELDEFFSALMISSVSLTGLAVFRGRRMKLEIQRREDSETLAASP